MNEVMLDIETFDVTYNSAIAQVTLVEFDLESGQTGESLIVNIDAKSCSDNGLSISSETLDWWNTRPENVIKSVFNNQQPLSDALDKINSFIKLGSRIWCSTSFDAPILINAYKKYKKFPPITNNNLMDIYTLTKLANLSLNSSEWLSKNHTSFENCVYQIDKVCKAYKTIFSQI